MERELAKNVLMHGEKDKQQLTNKRTKTRHFFFLALGSNLF